MVTGMEVGSYWQLWQRHSKHCLATHGQYYLADTTVQLFFPRRGKNKGWE
jgi:hypothetical protein